MQNSINCLMCFDKKYSFGALTALYFLIKNTDFDVFNIYLETDIKFNKKDIKKIKCRKVEVNLNYLDLNHNVFSNYYEYNRMSLSYSKISSLFLLPFDINKILFIDTDMIVQKNIRTFYENENNKIISAVKDCDVLQEFAKSLPLKPFSNETYFNAGLFKIDLNLLRQKYDLSSILSIFEPIKNKLLHHDQDLLNILLRDDKFVTNNYLYNYYFLNPYKKVKNLKELYDAYIVHFVGNPKPWFKNYTNLSLMKIFWLYGRHISFTKFVKAYVYSYLHLIKRKVFG